MILLLQILSVGITGMAALAFTLLVIAPALGGILHGKRFTINAWHAIAAGVLGSATVWLLDVYAFIEVAS